MESSIEMAINDTAIDDVIITGDFNDNQLDYSRTKISFLLTKFSLLQMIDEPTHFTEHSSSLIDLILTNTEFLCQSFGLIPFRILSVRNNFKKIKF